MKKLINGLDRVVADMLDGMAMLNPGLVLLREHHVALRADTADLIARGEVALVSGGGAGHEPAHAGYVGAGMLTAAVSGDVFTSPSTDAVLAAIRAVGGAGGVLLIVKNYTGDRLNFGLAAEIARTEGIACEMVVVADDVALAASDDNAGRRGLAGTVLVHKIAGAAAAAGAGLQAVKRAAEEAIAAVGTMGVALSACTVPAAGRPGFELGGDEIELGLGIHGEAGVRRARMAPADVLGAELLDTLIADRRLVRGDRIALLVNNLGATPTMEMSIVAGGALRLLAERGIVVERAWCGSFLTALEMAGVSLTVMKLDDAGRRLEWLDAATLAPAWPPASVGRVATKPALAAASAADLADAAMAAARVAMPGAGDKGSQAVAAAIKAVCDTLLAAEDELTRLDQVVGDGDLGISLARGAKALMHDLPAYPLADLAATLRGMSATLRKALGGTSGPLYAIMLLRAAAALDAETPAPKRLAAALMAGAAGIAEVGGAKVGDRTMLDALIPAAEALQAAVASGTSLADAMDKAVAAADAGTAGSAGIVARRGRSSYLGERAIGHADPGARAVTLWLHALARQARLAS